LVESAEVHRLDLVFCLRDDMPVQRWPRAKGQGPRTKGQGPTQTVGPYNDQTPCNYLPMQ